MKKCLNCNMEYDDDSMFCPNCGGKLTTGQKPQGMVCSQCGAVLEPGKKFCTICGAQIAASNNGVQLCPKCGTQRTSENRYCGVCGYDYTLPNPINDSIPRPPVDRSVVSIKDFLEKFADDDLKKAINGCYVAFIVFGIINIILALCTEMFPYDGLILLALAFWWKFNPGKPCAIAALIYTIFSVMITIIVYERFGGYLLVIAAIYMFIESKKISTAYEQFIKNQG